MPHRACVLLAALAVLAPPAVAHDTWFAPLPTTARGAAVLALGTGDQFPKQEFAVSVAQLQHSGCGAEDGRVVPLRLLAEQPTALVLRTSRALPANAALSCWAQLMPLDIEIDDATVEIYLHEIAALPAVRERWAQLRARGVRWHESYVKHARIELDGDTGDGTVGGQTPPAAGHMGLDVKLLDGPRPLRVGDTLRAQVLRDGQPLAGQPVQLRSNLSPLGVWRLTDADGRIEVKLPLAARWVLRGVDLRPSALRADAWDSRFVTLAFQVQPRR